ncbi:MAG: Rossmann-fold NAD(P)-binding domain-containing protein, partial [Planctomycetota bacterium]
KGGHDWVDVRDVAAGLLLAAERGRPGERYLLGGAWHSLREIADMVTASGGAPAPRMTVPLWLARTGVPFARLSSWFNGAPLQFTASSLRILKQYRHLSIDKAREKLGYSPRPVADAIRDTVAWFQSAGLIEPNAAFPPGGEPGPAPPSPSAVSNAE